MPDVGGVREQVHQGGESADTAVSSVCSGFRVVRRLGIYFTGGGLINMTD